MLKKIKSNQKGFTLVELIVVVAILGVLAAVAVPNYMNYLYKTRVSADVDSARAILKSARTMYMTTGKIADITLSNVLEDADLDQVKAASNDGTLDSVISEIDTTDTDNFSVTVTPGDKAGDYTTALTVNETDELPTPSK